MWKQSAYCATCDLAVRMDAEECPGCGAKFGPDRVALQP